jgi:hypothetical protein
LFFGINYNGRIVIKSDCRTIFPADHVFGSDYNGANNRLFLRITVWTSVLYGADDYVTDPGIAPA